MSGIVEIDSRSRYADKLGKELPRIPAVKTFVDFSVFSQAGRGGWRIGIWRMRRWSCR